MKNSDQDAVAAALKGHAAYFTRPKNGYIVVAEEESGQQDPETILRLGSALSKDLSCPVLAVLNHDDDILWYSLFENGEVTDEYDSTPGFFDSSTELSSPSGGSAQVLSAAFSGDVAMVESVLRQSSFDEDGYVFAFERHLDLAEALGLPTCAAGFGYEYIEAGGLPSGLSKDDLVKVN